MLLFIIFCFSLLKVDQTYGSWQASVMISGNSVSVGSWLVDDTMPDQALQAIADTYLREDAQDINEGGSLFMRVQSADKNRSLVQFSQAEIENTVGSKTLSNAKLVLEVDGDKVDWGSVGGVINIHRVTQPWVEGDGRNEGLTSENQYLGDGAGATWSCAVDPDIGNNDPDGCTEWLGGIYSVVPTDAQLIENGSGGTVEFDVTTDVLDFLNNPSLNNGWLIKKVNEMESGSVSFYTKESTAGNGPILILSFATPPSSASDGLVINEIYPVPPPSSQSPSSPFDREWIELYNGANGAIDVDGLHIKVDDTIYEVETICSGATNRMQPYGGSPTVLDPLELIVLEFCDNSANSKLPDTGATVELMDNELALDEHTYADTPQGKSHQRIPDGGIWVDPEPTPGKANAVTVQDLLNEGWTLEMIESVKHVVADYGEGEYRVGLEETVESQSELAVENEYESFELSQNFANDEEGEVESKNTEAGGELATVEEIISEADTGDNSFTEEVAPDENIDKKDEENNTVYQEPVPEMVDNSGNEY